MVDEILNEQGLKDAVRDLTEIKRTLIRREQQAEASLVAAEAEMMGLRKLNGFVDIIIAEHRERLNKLQNTLKNVLP